MTSYIIIFSSKSQIADIKQRSFLAVIVFYGLKTVYQKLFTIFICKIFFVLFSDVGKREFYTYRLLVLVTFFNQQIAFYLAGVGKALCVKYAHFITDFTGKQVEQIFVRNSFRCRIVTSAKRSCAVSKKPQSLMNVRFDLFADILSC